MTVNIRPKSVRTRLTFWYALTLTFVLVVFSIGVFVSLKNNLLGDLDRKLRDDIEAVGESLLDLPVKNGKADFDGYRDRANYDARDRWLLEVWNTQGRRVLTMPDTGSFSQVAPSSPQCARRGLGGETVATPQSLKLRVKCVSIDIAGDQYFIRVYRSADRLYEELKELLILIMVGIPIGIALASVGGYLLARRALSPVDQMTRQARSITAEKLKARLQVENPNDEIGKLALTFNEVFARLERSFDQMRRFSADASHELRTPLTVIRTLGEVALRDGHSGKYHTDAIASILEEADRLRHLVESLLALSRADAGQVKLKLQSENLASLITEVVGHLEVLAEEKNQTIRTALDPDISALCDRTVLRQAVINLVDNAIKYSPKNTEVLIRLYRNNSSSVLEVIDHGPGIAVNHQDRVFDRFYRIDIARTRDQGGTGLGLSIAQWAVCVNGGTLKLQSELGKGSIFRMTFPCTSLSECELTIKNVP